MDIPVAVLEQFPAAARAAAGLLLRPEVAARWGEESACAQMTVGALAFHLAGQSTSVVRLLSAPPAGDDVELLDVLGHYRRAAWVTAAPDDDVNAGIRDGAEQQASGGPEALAARVAADIEALPGVIRPLVEGSRGDDRVLVPWQGWALPGRDLVLTRSMEILVHSDDLAASVGVDPPEFPRESADAVLALLASVAASRHGVTPVLRALSRPQRAAGPLSAF